MFDGCDAEFGGRVDGARKGRESSEHQWNGEEHSKQYRDAIRTKEWYVVLAYGKTCNVTGLMRSYV